MAPQRKIQNMDADETQQPTVKRPKTSAALPATPIPQPNPRYAHVFKAAQTTKTTAHYPKNATKSHLVTTMRPVRLPRARRPASSNDSAKPKGPDFFSLPLELQQHILSFTTARDTTRLRRVCKTLNVVIKGSTKHLAKEFSRKELSRLQQHVDEFASLNTPTDFNSFKDALTIWTDRRGYFEDSGEQYASLMKLMAHLFLGKKTEGDLMKNVSDWFNVAVVFYWLYMEHHTCRTRGEHWSQQIGWTFDFDELTEMGVLDYKECDKLFECIAPTEPGSEPHYMTDCFYDHEVKEQMTFPQHGRITALLQYPPSYADEDERHRNWTVFTSYMNGDNPDEALMEATHGNLWLVRYLRLPKLPNEVTCYFLRDEWARKEVEKLLVLLDTVATKTDPVRVSPLLRAAILESVDLF